jgi:predicted porin
MKNSLLALSIMGLAGMASAQSSVTVYGIADIGVASDHGAFSNGALNSVISGGQTGSRLGFRGREDLGDGLYAIFNLQSGVNFDDGTYGQGGLPFGRTSYVGLEGKFGTVKLGRVDSALYLATWYYDPMGDGLAGALTRLVTLSSSLRRNNNTIDYTTPAINGFSGQVNYTFGEVAGNSTSGRRYSLGGTYASGPVSVSLSRQVANSAPVAPGAIVATTLTALAASYDFKVVKVSGILQTNKDDSAAPLNTRDLVVGAQVPVGFHTLLMSYILHKDRNVALADAKQLALGYTYDLSKRTNLYLSAAHITNDDKARFGLGAASAGGAVSGSSETLYSTGIRHSF